MSPRTLRYLAAERWRSARLAARRLHPAARPLPNFLIIGAQRSGTTSLFHFLAGHPEVTPPLHKEIQFLTLEWGRGLDWYARHFPPDNGRRRFEASPYYLYHPLAAGRATLSVPEAKFVALLRDPGARAYSHWYHNTSLGLEPLAFEAALAAEGPRLAGEEERLVAEPTYQSPAHRHHSYADRGRYHRQIECWQAEFPGRVLVLESGALFRDPRSTLGRILEFLDLEPWFPSQFVNRSKRQATNEVPPLDLRVRARLAEEFAADNERLARLVDWDPVATWSCQ